MYLISKIIQYIRVYTSWCSVKTTYSLLLPYITFQTLNRFHLHKLNDQKKKLRSELFVTFVTSDIDSLHFTKTKNKKVAFLSIIACLTLLIDMKQKLNKGKYKVNSKKEGAMKRRILKAPTANPRTYIYWLYKIDLTEGS